MVGYATIMVLIYIIGCPLMLFITLFRLREHLNPAGREEEEEAVIEERPKIPALADEPLSLFALNYRPSYDATTTTSSFEEIPLTNHFPNHLDIGGGMCTT